MPIPVRHAWLDDRGREVPATDNRLYATKCAQCGLRPECGVARSQGRFLCLGCLDEEVDDERDG
jgi:hypothetical protein